MSDVKTKVCTKCGEEQNVTEFYIVKDGRNGKMYQRNKCKTCEKKDYRKKYKTNKTEAEKRRNQSAEYRKTHEDKIKAYRQTDAFKQSVVKSYNNNGGYYKYRKNNLQGRMASTLRNRINSLIKNKTERFNYLIGTTPNQLYDYLLSKGYNPNVDHIDHIVPCKWFDMTVKEHRLISQHYLNLQPLSAKNNRIKHDKLPINWEDIILKICDSRGINSKSIIEYIETRRDS